MISRASALPITLTLLAAGLQADCAYSLLYESTGMSLLAPDGTVVDSVFGSLGPKWLELGHSYELAPTAMNYQQNDLGANWCPATHAMPNGDFGTPGELNTGCP